jgi:hypothetical protein
LCFVQLDLPFLSAFIVLAKATGGIVKSGFEGFDFVFLCSDFFI